MRKTELILRMKRARVSFHRSTKPYSLNGKKPQYHVRDEGFSVEDVPRARLFETVGEIEDFLKVKEAALAATSPEAAEEIMKAGGYV